MVYLLRQSDESSRTLVKSPIRTVITTITRKSVNMVAELDNDTAPLLDPRYHRSASGGQFYSSQGCYGECSGVGHKGSIEE